MNASFEEKSAWISLVALLVMLSGYFIAAGEMLLDGITDMGAYIGPLLVSVLALVVVMVVGHIIAIAVDRTDETDERDRLIAWRPEAYSSWILGAGAIAAIIVLGTATPKAWVANGLLVTLFLASIGENAIQIVLHRRGT